MNIPWRCYSDNYETGTLLVGRDPGESFEIAIDDVKPEQAERVADLLNEREKALDAERERNAKLERVLEVAKGLPAAMAPAGSDGGWVWFEEWESFHDAVNEALAALETP